MNEESKYWELWNSLWMGWALFTLGILNWVSFFYIGIRVRQRKWVLAGIGYAIPFVVMMISEGVLSDVYMDLAAGVAVALWPVSIIHAMLIRREYLERLRYRNQIINRELEDLRKQILREYEGKRSAPSVGPDSRTSPSANPSVPDSSQPSGLVDLNTASEEELATLPGMNLILAKLAVRKRLEKGGFTSVDDFADSLELKPHIRVRLKKLATVGKPQGQDIEAPDASAGQRGRLVDF
ncbi:ComEA family DNA-binding protein [Staphylospora marina]|uniref:ComEA family DNA-binding protein n=1 Tax=Staphylospora marina TaxID=2490858 RepID=UPI0013DDC838|nr:helix-hairpin-helix domain-containing protein [Staphylospora marina]